MDDRSVSLEITGLDLSLIIVGLENAGIVAYKLFGTVNDKCEYLDFVGFINKLF